MWKITEDFLTFEYGKLDYSLNKLAVFDLDDTITVFDPSYPVSYRFINNHVKSKFQFLHKNGYFIAITSNQNPLERDKSKITNFKIKISKLLEDIDIPIFFIGAKKYGRYRKPVIGMFLYVLNMLDVTKDKLKNIYFMNYEKKLAGIEKFFNGKKVKYIDGKSACDIKQTCFNNESKDSFISVEDLKINEFFDDVFYVGDSAGRQTDRSDADVRYAHNLKIKFYLPEEFFDGKNNALGYENMLEKYFRSDKFLLFEETKQEHLEIFGDTYFDQYQVVFIYGVNYTGKSFFIKNYINEAKKVVVNLYEKYEIERLKQNNTYIVLHFDISKEKIDFCKNMWKFLENVPKKPVAFKKEILKEFKEKEIIKVPWVLNTTKYSNFELEIFKQIV
ncbi:PNKP [Ecytonucleospora hepatopenaei]|uniref:PNKP n=1 Tax=Ecytonucleospora hepatopenaei TaxID=646526 RepID=A0A1W0E3X3_9MICR|nr:PNKP [Ecytonucleospora hepatopenaei]